MPSVKGEEKMSFVSGEISKAAAANVTILI
jgi:hypothetical protein